MINAITSVVQNHRDKQKKRSDQFDEEKRQMDRQRAMMGDRKVCLVSDFLVVSLMGLPWNDKKISRKYGVDTKSTYSSFFLDQEPLARYLVPFKYIVKGEKPPIEKMFELAAEKEMQERIDAANNCSLWHWNKEKLSGPEEFKERFIANKKETASFPAFRMGELKKSFFDSDFMRYENKSIRSGKGGVILKFLEEVSALHDYQELFRNDGDSGSDSEEKKRLQELSDKAGPVFVPSF